MVHEEEEEDEEEEQSINPKNTKKESKKNVLDDPLLEASSDRCHMRHLGEKYFDNMDPQQVQETLEKNLTEEVEVLTNGIFQKY